MTRHMKFNLALAGICSVGYGLATWSWVSAVLVAVMFAVMSGVYALIDRSIK